MQALSKSKFTNYLVSKNSIRSLVIALASTLTISVIWQSNSPQVHAETFSTNILKEFKIAGNVQSERNFYQNHNSYRNRPNGINIYKLSRISPKRKIHILDGDATGGGHGPGRGIPGKSEFPSRWSDRKVLRYISDIIKDPNSRWIRQPGKPPFRWRIEGTRERINIRVIVEPQGEGVITAFPTNRPRNP